MDNQRKPASDAVPTYQNLGRKTFWIFVLGNVQAPVVLLAMAALLFVLRGMPFVKTIPVANIGNYIAFTALTALVLSALLFIAALLAEWFVYKNYMFFLDRDALKIKRGVFTREEIAIPYRQIQNVDIEQDISYRMIGVSRLVILTAGHEDEKTATDETEGVLPAIDSALAKYLQSQLLERANVQTVVQE